MQIAPVGRRIVLRCKTFSSIILFSKGPWGEIGSPLFVSFPYKFTIVDVGFYCYIAFTSVDTAAESNRAAKHCTHLHAHLSSYPVIFFCRLFLLIAPTMEFIINFKCQTCSRDAVDEQEKKSPDHPFLSFRCCWFKWRNGSVAFLRPLFHANSDGVTRVRLILSTSYTRIPLKLTAYNLHLNLTKRRQMKFFFC